MKNLEFYKKYKTNCLPDKNISTEPWWQVVLTGIAAVLVEPLIVYKKYRTVPFTWEFYFTQMKYFLLIGSPFVLFYLWTRWRGSIKRIRKYYWIGKFEVIRKRRVLIFCYLMLSPGNEHKLKISAGLFNKIREGDFVIIRRDSLGNIEYVTQVKDFGARLAKSQANLTSAEYRKKSTSEFED